MNTPIVKEFFDRNTWTLTYIVYDKITHDAVIIDPVWNYDPASSKLSTQSVESVLNFIFDNNLKVHFILETHAHADHVSGAQVIKQKIPRAQVAIGVKITEVQKVFKNVFNLDPHFKTDGSQFDLLLEEGLINAGSLNIETIYTPGHTPACASYVIGDAVFTGDALFMPDQGTGRCDFPSGNADQLYTSVHDKLYKLPEHYRVFVGHDYQPNNRPLAFESSVGEQKESNIHLKNETSRDQYVHLRNERDRLLSAPRLLLPSVQMNIDAGRLPKPDINGTRYLKIPLKESS